VGATLLYVWLDRGISTGSGPYPGSHPWCVLRQGAACPPGFVRAGRRW